MCHQGRAPIALRDRHNSDDKFHRFAACANEKKHHCLARDKLRCKYRNPRAYILTDRRNGTFRLPWLRTERLIQSYSASTCTISFSSSKSEIKRMLYRKRISFMQSSLVNTRSTLPCINQLRFKFNGSVPEKSIVS